MAYNVKTFEDIYNTVMRRAKLPLTDTEALTACKEVINTRYHDVSFKQKWRWRFGHWDLPIPKKHTTGTIVAIQGDREITGALTSWTADHKGWWFKADAYDEIYKVISVNVATQKLLLSSTYAGTSLAAGANYKLFKFQHGLPPDCEELDYVWHDHYRWPMQIVTPRQMIETIANNPDAEGYVAGVTVMGFTAYSGPKLGQFVLGYDFLNDDRENDLELLTFPQIPDETHTLHIFYQKKMGELKNATDEPMLPHEKRQILVYGALADMFYRERNKDLGTFFEAKFAKMLGDMENDQEFTDERPLMYVPNMWDRGETPDPASMDLGNMWDRFYSKYKVY